MQLLLDFGADPNHQNNKKNGPLHIACAIQNKKAAKILIEHGANIMLENWQYQKPHEVRPDPTRLLSSVQCSADAARFVRGALLLQSLHGLLCCMSARH